jgi:hypothetical protein
MKFFRSAEDKRIEFLLAEYKSAKELGAPEDEALLKVIGELKMLGGPLKNNWDGLSKRSKKEAINKALSPLDINTYDLVKLTSFMIAWEFPKYNKRSTVDEIRAGQDSLSLLNSRVAKIKDSK